MIKLKQAAKNRQSEAGEPILRNIPIDRIRPNPYQPRKVFCERALAELSSSIVQLGLLQPISVRQVGPEEYELIAGERRLRACKMAGMSHIRAMVTLQPGEGDMAMLAMIENLQREDLHFFEEAEGYQNLIREHGFTQEELARRLSKNQSTIANKLRILRLSRPVKERICRYGLTERHARALLRLHHEPAQLALLEKIGKEGCSVKETEALVEKQLLALYGEEHPAEKKVLRIRCGWQLYVNTVKKSVEKLRAAGADAQLSYEQKGEVLEICVRIKK